ncbi:hypothetical protein [Mycobacterium sp. HUMS_1102779]
MIRYRIRRKRQVFRVLRPGGRLHRVDITVRDGLAAPLMRHNHHAAGKLGDAVPRPLRAAGFDRTLIATHRQRVVGGLNYYRATRPA